MKLAMKFVLAVAVFFSGPACATEPVEIGQFGQWTLSSNPPMLPPAGQPMPPGGYLANSTTKGDLRQRISNSGDVMVLESFVIGLRECDQRRSYSLRQLSSGRPNLVSELKVQAETVLTCAKYDHAKLNKELSYVDEANRDLSKLTAYFFGKVQ